MKKIKKVEFVAIKEKTPAAVVIDMRSPILFRDGHVDGAVNWPLRNFLNKLLTLPKNTTLIMYSTTYSDSDLVHGINYAEQLGFNNIYAGEYSALV